MPKNNQNFNQELEGFLRACGFDNLSTKDVDGDDVPSSKEADQFIFQYSRNGKDYGNVVITTHGGKVSVYYNKNLNRGPGGTDTGWTKFLMKLKDWVLRNGQMEFKAGNIDNIGYEMKKRKQQKREESLSEGYYGTRHTSYSDNTPKIKMIIKHSKSIDEGDQRYRYIDKIFLENELGERVLIPTKKPSVGRAFARHLAEGGQYNDERWKHIREIAEDISSLGGFVRATKTKQFNESVMQVVNEATGHYQKLRETIKKLQNSRGYNMYFENWQPRLMEQDSEQDFSSMFVSNRLDPRIEQALPVLSKLNIKVNDIHEAIEFEQWANSIVEGQSPAMDHKVKEFSKLLNGPDPLPVGADAMNVKGQIEDLIDDQDHRNALFDELDDLAYSDPDNDSIPTIISFLQKHKDENFYGEVLDQIGEKTDIQSDQEIATEPETAEQTPVAPPAAQTPPGAASPAGGGAAAPFMPQPLAEKTKKPAQRNFVAKNAQRSGAGAHGKQGYQRHDKHKRKLGEEGVAEDTDQDGFHTRVQRGDFRPSKYGEDEYNYLHDLMNTSGDGSGPQLVTINDKKIARQIAAMYGGDVEETGMGTYRIVQRRGNSPMGNKSPKLTGVAEGSNDTIYPNAEVIKLRNGRPIGEIYQDENGWGFFHYGMDSGNDFIDSREDAIEGLRDLHQETVRSRPDYTIKGVAEGSTSKEKQKTPYRDINSPEYKAAAEKQKEKMTKDKATEPGKKLLDKIEKKDVAEDSMDQISRIKRLSGLK